MWSSRVEATQCALAVGAPDVSVVVDSEIDDDSMLLNGGNELVRAARGGGAEPPARADAPAVGVIVDQVFGLARGERPVLHLAGELLMKGAGLATFGGRNGLDVAKYVCANHAYALHRWLPCRENRVSVLRCSQPVCAQLLPARRYIWLGTAFLARV